MRDGDDIGALAAAAAAAAAADRDRGQRAAVDDCWNRIGIRGDRSCPKLSQYIHCRNCPVFSTAAHALLDVPLPAGHAPPEAAGLPAAPVQSAAPAHDPSLMVFRAGAEWFALPTRLCLEVASLRPIHSLPHRRRGALQGLASVRGQLVVCASISALVSTATASSAASAPPAAGARARLLLVDWPDGAVAFPVDEIDGVQRFGPQQRLAAPATVTRSKSPLTTALLVAGDRTIGLLDPQLLHAAIRRSLA
jgi:chemotaxis-related protein WspD